MNYGRYSTNNNNSGSSYHSQGDFRSKAHLSLSAQSVINNIQDFKKIYATEGLLYSDFLKERILNKPPPLLQHQPPAKFQPDEIYRIPGLRRLYENIDERLVKLSDEEQRLQHRLRQHDQLSAYDELLARYDTLRNSENAPRLFAPRDNEPPADGRQDGRNFLAQSAYLSVLTPSGRPGAGQPEYPRPEIAPRFNNQFVLRIDVIAGLSSKLQKIQLFLEFYLPSTANIKCSWSNFYRLD